MFGSIGFPEIIVIGIVAVLLFGRKLPQVARNAGSVYRDFRKQIGDLQSTFTSIEDEVKSETSSDEVYDDDFNDNEEPLAPRFEPPPEDEDE